MLRTGIAAILVFACLGPVAGRAQDGVETVVETPAGLDKQGKPKAPIKSVCWLPTPCPSVRGVIVAHPMIGDLATEARFRKVAAEEGLGTLLMRAFTWDAAESWEHLDAALEQWATASGHPELRGAPVLLSGLSTSVLIARMLVYERPQRVLGIIHVAGGNLHQNYPEGKTLSGVPFIAMNGEYESCGPEGGIRPHLGLDTQWYLMGEQMLERRRQDPNHLMSLVVVPIKGHTAWNKQIAELFIRKAARYRLPKAKRDGSSPAVCATLTAEDGWLTDRNVKHPAHEAAAWADYTGDKREAFWHFDEEMARAVCRYHVDGIRPGQDRSLFRPLGLFDTLWPIPQHMDIPFEGHSVDAHATAIRVWVEAKTGEKVSAIARRFLAQSIATGLEMSADGTTVDEAVCRRMCLRVCYAYDDAYRPIEEAIDQAPRADEAKAALREHYARLLLLQWPHGERTPQLSVRELRGMVAALPSDAELAATADEAQRDELIRAAEAVVALAAQDACGNAPAQLAPLLEAIAGKDSKDGWAAVDTLATLDRSVVPTLVRTMEWAGPPADMRAAAALGKLGAAAAEALPDLRRFAATGGRTTEQEGLACVMALEAIAQIERSVATDENLPEHAKGH